MSLKIGVIFCGYNTADLLPMSLTPWIEARRGRLGGNEFLICGVSCPFEGFDHGGSVDNTTALLEDHRLHNDIDSLITSNCPVKETEARGDALRWLVARGVTHLWQVDSDERYTERDILNIIAFVEAQPYVITFKLSLRNLVFDEKHALAEPFTPMRIHKVHASGGYKASGFWDDNNVRYTRPWIGAGEGVPPSVGDIEFASMVVPAEIALPLHYTWLANLRSKQKQEYQRRRWGACAFRWDETTDSLRFNETYYARRGLPLPEVLTLPDPI